MASKEKRGVIYIVWGDQADGMLERSKKSLQQHHPELPVEVVRIKEANNSVAGMRSKSRMMSLSPFAETLFLDADTVVFGRLDFGFEMAERYGLACCLADNPWQRRHLGVHGDACEYDTGVLFFGAGAKPVFDAWTRLAPHVNVPVSVVVDGRVEHRSGDERLGFAYALEQAAFAPFVLPLNWSFSARCQRTFFGPIKLWRGDGAVPAALAIVNDYYERSDAIVQFHELGP